MDFISLEYPNNPNSCSSQAVEIAIDAHATRLIQNNSPPEACVDSSLGPYITSILREVLLTSNKHYTNNAATSTTVDELLSSSQEYESLIELLESQCMMELQVASHVIHEIARAITTNGRGEYIYNRSTLGHNNKNYDYYPSNSGGGGGSPTDKRSRSKSLGAEKELDVNLLGKILETMTTGPISHDNVASLNTCSLGCTSLDYQPITTLPQSRFDDVAFAQHPPVTNIFVSGNCNNNSNSSSNGALLSKDRQDRNQRHVSFDETYSTSYDNNSPQCRGDSYLGSTMLSSMNSSWQACLGASLGFLDLEEDEDDAPQEENNTLTIEEDCVQIKEDTTETRRGSNNSSVVVANGGASTTSEVINSELAQCHPVSGFPDLAPSSGNSADLTITTTSGDKPPTNPKRGGASSKKRSSKKEAEELVAALFVTNSRPRSNSLPLQVVTSGAGTPTSYPYEKGVFNNIKSSISLAPTETSATTESTESAVIIESTTEILLTMNYHLGHEAASMASQLSHGDLNLAQYLIEAARSMTSGNGNTCSYNSYGQRRRTRICRHELQGTCYRHDCPYSHDIAGVTCLFWLKGRCHHTDGSSCRFMHGFAESLLEGVSEDYFKDAGETMTKEQDETSRYSPREQHAQENLRRNHQGVSLPMTTNLLQRNEWSGDGGSNQTAPTFGNNLWSTTPSSLENR